ncbi:MAG: 6-carboxytetrahydropterin synthase [Bacteroidales bacterium]|nr:6-carboxytetrahydropterin synthase [Bacteroidales bacterium]
MYYVQKTIEVSAAHRLNLSYESKCTGLHGHNWEITIYCRAKELNKDGMVCDFSHLKDFIVSHLDHKVLNEVFDFNPTAENIARWVVDSIPECYRADVKESRNNIASYEAD